MHVSSTLFLTTLAVASIANGASGPDRTGVVDSTDPIAGNIFEPSLFEQAPAEETLEKRVAALEKRLAERDPATSEQHRGKGGLAKHPASQRKGAKEHKDKHEHDTNEKTVELEARAVRNTGSRVNPNDATGPINALRTQHNLTSIEWNANLANAAQTFVDQHAADACVSTGWAYNKFRHDAMVTGIPFAQGMGTSLPIGDWLGEGFPMTDYLSLSQGIGCGAHRCAITSDHPAGTSRYYCQFDMPWDAALAKNTCTIM